MSVFGMMFRILDLQPSSGDLLSFYWHIW